MTNLNITKLQPILKKFRQLDPTDQLNDTYLGLQLIEKNIIDPQKFDITDEIKATTQFIKDHSNDYQHSQPLDVDPKIYRNKFLAYTTNNINYAQYFYFFTNQETFSVISLNINVYNRTSFTPFYCYKENCTNEIFNQVIDASYYLTWLTNIKQLIYRSQVINNLAKLIYYQNQQSHHDDLLQTDENLITNSDFIKTLANAISDSQRNNYQTNITVWDFCLLIHNLRIKQHLTQTQSSWLLNKNHEDNGFINDYLNNIHLEHFVKDNLAPLPKNIQKLYNTIQNYKNVSELKIYDITNQHETSQENNTIYGIHGTNAESIPSIVSEGLKDAKTLSLENHQHYEYTGSGLGNGIYFAKLNQFQKALNYTGSYSNTVYALVCEINYNKIKHTTTYGNYDVSHNEDLVWGHGVGSHDRDELVAKRPDQVKIKYLLEIHYN